MSFRDSGGLTIMTVATDPEISHALTAARSGDQAAFAALIEPHRRELQVHCYRMLGSFTDAEDMVQETLLRAWRHRETFAGRSTFRAWLYRIATNACLDHLERHPRRPGGDGEVTWLQPFPDRLLERAAPPDAEPDAVVVARETIELAFLVAVQHLPPRQRAVLMLRDVLGWSAAESAAVLEASVASVNSALQRARATLREQLPRRRSEWAAPSQPTDEERSVLQRFMQACERADMPAIASLLREDAVFSMPPQPEMTRGRDAILELWEPAFGQSGLGDLLLVPVWMNRQPAAANYARTPGDSVFRAIAVDVLRVEGGVITDVVSFEHTAAFPVFDLLGLPVSR